MRLSVVEALCLIDPSKRDLFIRAFPAQLPTPSGKAAKGAHSKRMMEIIRLRKSDAVKAAEQQLLELARDGVRVWGRPGHYRALRMSGSHDIIEHDKFFLADRVISGDGWTTISDRSPEWWQWEGPDWGDLQIDADGLKAALLRTDGRVGTASPSGAPASQDAAQPPQRLKPTNPALRKWFRVRVQSCPNDTPAPSEQEDWKAASAHFDDTLRRDEFRQIRAEETPPEWRKSGPRKSWGTVKSSLTNAAANPAKLRPQN